MSAGKSTVYHIVPRVEVAAPITGDRGGVASGGGGMNVCTM